MGVKGDTDRTGGVPNLGGLLPNEPSKAAASAECPGPETVLDPSAPGRGVGFPEWGCWGVAAWDTELAKEATGDPSLAMESALEFAAGDLPMERLGEDDVGT